MRKLAAQYIIDGDGTVYRNSILELDRNGFVLGIRKSESDLKEEPGLEFYSGILVPGFINTHCHLELSHLFGAVPEHTGLVGFINNIQRLRKATLEEIENSARKAEVLMKKNGIVAVGDISNTPDTFSIKKQNSLIYRTFIEAFGSNAEIADEAFEKARNLFVRYNEHVGSDVSVVPHAPYSMSDKLFEKVLAHAVSEESILTIHNQESDEENRMFTDGTGEIEDYISKFRKGHFTPSGKTSLQSSLPRFSDLKSLILVHNTFTSQDDIIALKSTKGTCKFFFSLCPGANLYIENTLPDIELLRSSGIPITLGTDSLASNKTLSILEEMKIIMKHYTEISLPEVITWGTRNGAEALSFKLLGSFGPGKKPGVNLITGADLYNLKLKPESKVKVLC